MCSNKVAEKFGKSFGGLLAVFLTIMWFFGAEPQILRIGRTEMSRFTYTEYMEGSLRQNGDAIYVRVLTTIAYPGAKVGRLMHNALMQ